MVLMTVSLLHPAVLISSITISPPDSIDVDVVLNTNMGVVEHSIANVPVKENYRTNILGDFLTTGATFNIVVDERFEVRLEFDGHVTRILMTHFHLMR